MSNRDKPVGDIPHLLAFLYTECIYWCNLTLQNERKVARLEAELAELRHRPKRKRMSIP